MWLQAQLYVVAGAITWLQAPLHGCRRRYIRLQAVGTLENASSRTRIEKVAVPIMTKPNWSEPKP